MLLRPADVVVLDQFLDTYTGKTPKMQRGTEIAAELHRRGFKGLVCLLSGGSKEDLAKYLTEDGVHMVATKADDMKSLSRQITKGYWDHRAMCLQDT
mmetsp:Transcript_24789/g.33994  ORF Transcript_24789/g.33994 Transcript_24789/m.33994 type:complete len:97 (+) Transcript_24789:1-291(+)